MSNHKFLMTAAIAGMIGAASAQASVVASAAPDDSKGHCMGANSCKGQGSCSQKGMNSCSGQNSCKGKGFLEKTKMECNSMMKKDKKIHFEAAEKS